MIQNFVTIREDKKRVGQQQQHVIVFWYDDFDEAEVYCCKRWVKIINEGTEAHLFEIMAMERVRKGQKAGIEGRNDESTNLHEDILWMRNNAEDIALVQAAGFYVDDDNAPLPENIATKEQGDKDVLVHKDGNRTALIREKYRCYKQ